MFWRDVRSFGESPEEITVISKAAQFSRVSGAASVDQELLRLNQSFGCDVLVDGGSGRRLKDPAYIRRAQMELPGNLLQADRLAQMLIDVGDNAVYLYIVAIGLVGGGDPGSARVLRVFQIALGHVDHHQAKGTAFHDIGAEITGFLQRVDIKQKSFLLFREQMYFMAVFLGMIPKTFIQIRSFGADGLEIIRRNVDQNTLMGSAVHACQAVALKLIDEKNIPRFDRVKLIIDQELLSPGDRVIELVAIMHMDSIRLFIIEQAGNGKIVVGNTGSNCFFTTVKNNHQRFAPFVYGQGGLLILRPLLLTNLFVIPIIL